MLSLSIPGGGSSVSMHRNKVAGDSAGSRWLQELLRSGAGLEMPVLAWRCPCWPVSS